MGVVDGIQDLNFYSFSCENGMVNEQEIRIVEGSMVYRRVSYDGLGIEK